MLCAVPRAGCSSIFKSASRLRPRRAPPPAFITAGSPADALQRNEVVGTQQLAPCNGKAVYSDIRAIYFDTHSFAPCTNRAPISLDHVRNTHRCMCPNADLLVRKPPRREI